MHKKDKFVGLKKIYKNNDVHNESFENKKPKKKIYDKSSTELKTYTEENTCEKDIEQDITDSYSRKDVNLKKKPEINALADISLVNKWSLDNDNVSATEKHKKNKSLDINSDINEAEIKSFEGTCVEVREQNINGSDFTENVKKLSSKKKYIKSLNLIELNAINDAEIKSLEGTCKEVNEQNIIDAYSRKNVNRKRKSEINALTNISLGDVCSIDNENVPTKKTKKKKNHDGNLNSIESNTNHDTEIQIFERTHEEVNDSDNNENVIQIIRSALNASSNVSLKNKRSMENDSVITKKHKKEKKHNKSLNSTELNNINDADCQTYEKKINAFDFTENISQKIMSETNASPTKKPKKKKNHNKSCSLTELDINHDKEIQILEKTYEEVNDSDYRENVNKRIKSKLNTLTDISLENKCSMNTDNVEVKKPYKKKKHNRTLNSIKNNLYHDTEIQIFERTDEEVDDSDNSESVIQIIRSELNSSENISLKNKCSFDENNAITKKSKKKKKHNKSLNSIELTTNIDTYFKTHEKKNELNINGSDSKENIILKRMSEIQFRPNLTLEDMGKDCNNANENILNKNHNKSLNSKDINTNHDTEIKTFENTCKEVSEPNVNDSNTKELTPASLEISCSLDDENIATKESKKRKNHNTNLNPTELNTINDADCQTYEKKNEHKINAFDLTENISPKIMSEINASPTKKPKKKKNHNKSCNLTELDTNHDKEIQILEKTYEEVNDFNYRENVNQRIKSKLNTSTDIFLEYKCGIDTDNVATKKPKKNKKHYKSLNSVDINTDHDTKLKTFERTCKDFSEVNMNNSDTKELSSASLEVSYDLGSEHIATEESKKRKKHNILKTVISDCTDENQMPMISQNQFKLKTLLNSMEKYNFEESSTIDKTNFNLKCFNLMKYLTNKDPSLKNHPNFKQIREHLSKKIKLTINTKCEVGASDILLLKTVGKIILKKIVEKINSAKDIKDLVIKLPAESQKNKIHFIETTLSRLPNKLTMEIIKEQNPLIKLRVFNEDEDKMIREYWSKFQKEYNISNILPFLSNGLEMALSPKERLQFIRYISAGLPNRLLYSVFNRFNILFNEYQDKTSFSEEEDQLIIKVDKCDAIRNKLSVLSLILNRTRLQLYRKIEVLRNQHKECKKVIWDDQKRQELFTNILLETNTEHWKHLKSLTITKDIWIKIAKNLGEDFTYEKVRYQWNYIYTMLFCEKPILTSTLKLTTLDLLKQINAKYWSDLDWTEITNKLYPGANSKVICAFFHSWVDKNVPSNIKRNIRDTLNYLQLHEVDKLKRRIDEHGEREFPMLTVKHFDLLVNSNQ